MQTIGKAANKMDFPLNWTDILLKSISGKTNYTIDVKIGTKRIATNQDLKDITKKRRKQSNPTRISSNEDNTKNGKLLFFDRKKVELNNSKEAKDLKLTCHQYPSTSLPLNLTISENQKLSSNGEQKLHFSNDIQLKNDSSIEISNNPNSSYQPCTKEIPNIDKKENYAIESSTCISSLSKSQPCTSGINVAPTSVQIFNPEAFCDQCNKEFCNKYFLKTHKANKHGVFSDNHSNSFSVEQSDRIKVSTFPPTCDFSSNINDNYIGASTSSLFKSPILFSQSSVNTNTYVSKNNMFNNQTRAFCSICNKEFCNKYFVRRHKAKIHGITDESDYKTIDDAPFNSKTNLQIKNEFLDFGVPDSCDTEVKIISPSFYANESISEVSKEQEKLFLKDTQSVDYEEGAVTKYTAVEIPHGNLTAENTNREKNVDCINKLNNETCNLNDLYSNDLTSNSSVITNTHYENAVFQNGISKPNTKDIHQMRTEFESNTSSSPINLITNNSENDGVSTDNSIGKKMDDSNNDDPATGKAAENETDKMESTSKSKSHTLESLFLKLNGSAPDNDMSTCYVCNTHVDGSLKMHVFDKHENIVDELTNGPAEEPDGPSCRIEYPCHECRRMFDSDASLREHVEQCECGARGAASSGHSAENDEHAAGHRGRGPGGERRHGAVLSSFCSICNKELCNKYFMKTHMQRMHGISIQNGNHIGGVVCDICNKELCSKYFLRVHKQNSHGVAETAACQRHWTDPVAENADEPPEDGHRYYKHYTEVCNICLRRFRSSKWLTAHLLNDHGAAESNCAGARPTANHGKPRNSADERQNVVEEQQNDGDDDDDAKQYYRCSYCPFATSILSFLFVHEKFHLADNHDDTLPLTCPTCCTAFPNRARLDNHFARCTRTDRSTVASRSPPSAGLARAAPLGANGDPSAAGHQSLDDNGNDVSAAKLGPPRQTLQVASPPSADNNDFRVPESNHEPFIMQSFFLENCSVSPSATKTELGDGRSDSFHSSLVYLPVKEKLTSTVNVFFKLTPTT